ncbi:hypothetical protein RA273_29075, partial [Pseudomonas syringae pv. tagetis]
EPNGFKDGDMVEVSAVDYCVEAVEGELVFTGREDLILRREDERAGVLHVHFPRMGYRIEKRCGSTMPCVAKRTRSAALL